MRFKLVALLIVLLSVGAWGQTGKTGIVDCAAHPDLCRDACAKFLHKQTTEHYAEHECFNATCLDKCASDDNITESSHKLATVKHIKVWEPEDVPAIQEPNPFSVSCKPDPRDSFYMNCSDSPEMRWTCADRSRTLLSSEDGKTHYCHKSQLESK